MNLFKTDITFAPQGGTPINIRRGGPKVELNPKPKKILNFGDFGTLKNTCRNIWYPKNIQCFPFVTVRMI